MAKSKITINSTNAGNVFLGVRDEFGRAVSLLLWPEQVAELKRALDSDKERTEISLPDPDI